MKLKRVLIISPYFPPTNAADMQRIRMSLPYFKEFSWKAEVVIVNPSHSDMVKDPLLLQTIPNDIPIHTVEAFSKKWTSKFGLGSLALRSLWFYRKKVDTLLKQKKYDLIYFSTTQLPVCILGAYWKKKFNIPYVIDMQDPWHSTYYEDKPRAQRPAKYWFSYRLNKYLEPLAMNSVDGIISVSDAYITQLKERYKNIRNIPNATITFGYFKKDFDVTEEFNNTIPETLKNSEDKLNLVYIGRGGYDMQAAIRLIFSAFKALLKENPKTYKQLRFHFIGTSYAPSGKGTKTILPIAEELDIAEFVNEQTDRISYFENIKCLRNADALIVPGSNDPAYTASKIYPYILARKPLLAVLLPSSSAFEIIKTCQAGTIANLNETEKSLEIIKGFLTHLVNKNTQTNTQWQDFEAYSARSMAETQCVLFNKVIC